MSTTMWKHIHGGLINTKNAPHVIAAVQVLLHTSSMVNFLNNDEEHRKTCRSLLKCMLCSLFEVYSGMARNGIGDPTSLVMRWAAISSHMSTDKKTSPQEVLKVFINVMRMQHVGRDSKFNLNDFHSSPMACIWKSVFTCQVTCPSCGQFEVREYETAIHLKLDTVYDLHCSIIHELSISRNESCMRCQKLQAKMTYSNVIRFADCLIVHVEKCASDFVPPLELNILENDFNLRSLIAETTNPNEKIVFVSACPDGRWRKFIDSKLQISLVSAAQIMSEFIHQCRPTLIYEKKVRKPLVQEEKHHSRFSETSKTIIEKDNHGTVLRTSTTSSGIKITSFPKLSGQGVLDLSGLDLSESEKNAQPPCAQQFNRPGERTASTQTCEFKVDQEVQTGPYFSYETCKDDKKFKFFTGVCPEDFQALYNLIGGHTTISQLKFKYSATPKKLRPTKLSSKDKLFMFLLRLRRGLPLEEMSVMFNCSVSWVGEICYAMTRLIYLTFKEMEKDMFPTAAEQKKNKPQKMKPFKNLRILLDGVSFFIQTPTNFEQQGNTFSTYKSHNLLVFSVGISCNGATIFCSDGMEGSMSDKEVILKSGLLDRLTAGDAIMTDRGYELTAELQAIGCEFFKPPTLVGRKNFTAEEEILTKAIASARIYTEHAMADIKDNRLLQGVIPLSLLPVISDLVYIAAYLRNFNPSRILNKAIVPRERECESGFLVDDPDDPV